MSGIKTEYNEISALSKQEKSIFFAILLCIPLAFFLNLNSYQLIYEEPRRALIALEMILSGNNIVPTTNGYLYYNKPPLYNWVLIAFFKLFGTAEWVVRLPTILSLLITGFIHFKISKIHIGCRAALLSALFYVTSVDILFFFSYLGEIDLFYSMLVYLQAALFFHFAYRKQWHWAFILSYIFTMLGVLTKGIPSLVFQAFTLVVILISTKQLKRVFSIWHFAGIALMLLGICGYFYAYAQYHPVWPLLARLFTETFSRSALEKSSGDSLLHLVNFPVLLLRISMPYILLFSIATYSSHIKSNAFIRFCFWFVLTNILIYWLSPGTRGRYLYMFLPFIYAILGAGLAEGVPTKKVIWLKYFYWFIGVSSALAILVMAVFGHKNHPLSAIALTGVFLTLLPIGFLLKTKIASSLGHFFAIIFFILLARIGYDITLLPTRRQHDPYRKDAINMAKMIGKEDVYFTGTPQRTSDVVKFARHEFAAYERNEPAFLAFQTSFYLSQNTNKIVKYTPKLSKPGFYIAAEKETDRNGIKVFYRFNNRRGKQNNWFLLYKYN